MAPENPFLPRECPHPGTPVPSPWPALLLPVLGAHIVSTCLCLASLIQQNVMLFTNMSFLIY